MKNINIISTFNQICGISTYSQFLVEALKREKSELDIRILAEKAKNKDLIKGIVKVPIKRTWARTEPKFEFQIKENIVHVQYEPGIFGVDKRILDSLLNLKRRKNILVITHHVIAEYEPFITLQKALSYLADAVIVHSQDQYQALQKIGAYTDKTMIIPHGTYQQPEIIQDLNQFYPNLIDKELIVIHGFISADKGHHLIFEAFKRIMDKYPNLALAIVGSPHPGHDRNGKWILRQYVKTLMKFAIKNKFEDKVFFDLGFASDARLDSWLARAKLLLYPLEQSPQPIHSSSGNIHRAIGVGVPVIGSNTHRLKDLGDNAMIITNNNPVELASAISYILDNKNIFDEYKEKIQKYSKLTSWENVAKQHLELYNKVIFNNPDSRFFGCWRMIS